MALITEAQIQAYINEKKMLPQNFSPSLRDKSVNSQTHAHFDCEIKGENGNIFKIIIKQSKINPLDFSIIFGVMVSGKVFRLKRYNGNHGEHCNTIERQWFDGCHIHKATERYQEIGFREEHFAEATTKYSDWNTALKIMLKENNFHYNVGSGQMTLNK